VYLISLLIWGLLFNKILLKLNSTGEFNWLMLSALGTIFLGVVAIFPIIKDARHRKKYCGVLRDLIYVDVRDINESYHGKLETKKYIDNWEKDPNFTALIPKHDFSHEERRLIGELIRTFKRETYHKESTKRPKVDYDFYTFNFIKKAGIDEIVKLTDDLLGAIKKRIDDC
jgi:hypothetical protein